MKKGLLLTAFLTTLVLDMGVGPVLIVFGGMNLSKQTSYPSAAWLMVRGIVNCVQFIIVMFFTLIVSRTKGKYSRKEETILIARLLGSHPLAYFYYMILLFGIVWNILGSCWIAAAFRHYTVGFASCYLVGVILAWISVVASPLFVFSGGLFYGSLKNPILHNEPNTIQLVSYGEESMSITNILNNLHNDGIAITAEDILYRSQKPVHRSKPITLTEAEKPVLVDNIEHLPVMEERISLIDSLLETDASRGLVFFQQDVLDDELPVMDPVLQPMHSPVFHPVQEQPCVEVVTVLHEQREEREVIPTVPSEIPAHTQGMQAMSPILATQATQATSTTQTMLPTSQATQATSTTQTMLPTSQATPTTSTTQTMLPTSQATQATSTTQTTEGEQVRSKTSEKKTKRKEKPRYVNPKERVVLVDESITVPLAPNSAQININEEYIDVSVQMQESINRGEFNHSPDNINIFSSTLANL